MGDVPDAYFPLLCFLSRAKVLAGMQGEAGKQAFCVTLRGIT